MPDIYTPFKTGYTVESRGLGEEYNSAGEQAIIIGTRKILSRYSISLFGQHDTDKSPENTLYGTYNVDDGKFWWYYGTDVELICTNQDRGIKILKNMMNSIPSQYGMSSYMWDKFIKDYLQFPP